MRLPLVDISVLGVVVPARNEERRLPRCLTALSAAAAHLPSVAEGGPRVRVIVVVDRSTDRTWDIARRWPGVEVLTSDAGRVGAARRAGVDHLLRGESRDGVRVEQVWVDSTDADSVVPTDWLSTHLQHARSGAEMLLGTVRPDPQELAAGLLAAWRLRHLVADGHPHVHAANLGVRGDVYRAAGGFADVAVHEDVLLSRAVRGAGGRVLSIGSAPVLTSGRISGRTPGGMALYLRELAEDEIQLEA